MNLMQNLREDELCLLLEAFLQRPVLRTPGVTGNLGKVSVQGAEVKPPDDYFACLKGLC